MEKAEELSFALRFITDHPTSAVKVLEQNDPKAVGNLLSAIPPAYASTMVRHMTADHAARLLAQLGTQKAAAILADLDASHVAAIMRLQPQEWRFQLLEEFSTTLRKNTELLLTFPASTVGAWMSPYLLSVADDLKCKNILRTMRTSDAQDDSEYVYIVDREGSYLGRTRLLDILKAGENQQVAAIMDTSCPALPAAMVLPQANEHKAWHNHDVLPVTSRQGRLLGILHHHALRAGLEQHKTGRHTRKAGHDPVSSIFEVYGQSLLALLNSVSEAVDSDRQ